MISKKVRFSFNSSVFRERLDDEMNVYNDEIHQLLLLLGTLLQVLQANRWNVSHSPRL